MNCPTTKFYNKLKTRFQKKWEEFEEIPLEECACPMKLFQGKLSSKLFKKLKSDKKTRTDISRGVMKPLTIMFADIRNFTHRTENMPPEKIINLLDLFIPEMLHIIMERHKGMVDKLLGDGIMALYGHPYSTGEEIIQALYSAVDMNQAAAAMAAVLEIMDYEPIEIGVGINTGNVLICEIGSRGYKESTVIGAPVNLAAKMEDIALANEIVLPGTALTEVENLRPFLMSFFEKKQSSGPTNDVYNFDWVRFLNNNKREKMDWELI
jgi:class 3 adenylate cyclase